MATDTAPLRIDVYADVVCSWCYLGVRRLERALEQRSNLPVERRWHPFQLRPEMPSGGQPWHAFAKEKFGSWDRACSAFEYVQKNAEGDDVTFDVNRITSAPNTVDAHRLILWAGRYDRTWDVVEGLFRSYFTEGADLNDHDALAAVAASAGLDGDAARSFLVSDQERSIVRQEQQQAERNGVRGVPFFVLDDRYTFSGAQTPDLFLRAFDAVMREREKEDDEVPAH